MTCAGEAWGVGGERRPYADERPVNKEEKIRKAKSRNTTAAKKGSTAFRAPKPKLPKFSQLPIKPGAPKGSAWGVFGDNDQLGTINLLTPERVREATTSVRSGRVFALNLPINIPDPPIFGRGKHSHEIVSLTSFMLDDSLNNFYPQASSQWDALCHVKHPTFGAYNGIPDCEITGYGGSKLGIDNLARHGIVGRGVLADIGRYYERHHKHIDFMTNQVIPLADLEATLAWQKTRLRTGDILLIRIGWTVAYLLMGPEQKEALAANTCTPGIEGSEDTAQWLWNHGVAAIGSDSPALEAFPPPGTTFAEAREALHFYLLAYLGMPIGELWDLEELAKDCAADGCYDFLFTSAPLNIPGGVGSPPNALAIK
jgi:kynurenine formamidase